MAETQFRAVFKDGVAVPIEPIQVPDGTEALINVVSGSETHPDHDENQKAIFEILSRRYASGHTDTAARHNEHQP